MSSRYPLPSPWGWFQIGFASDVPAGEIRSVRLCGNDYVLVRGRSGDLALLEAYCPHQGAKLDEPAKPLVDGERLVCPFHGWQYDLSGRCVEVPYSEQIPAGACLGSLPLAERAGMLFAWYHPEGISPSHDLPGFVEGAAGDPAWELTFETEVRCHVQEWGEQAADPPHFPAVHGAAGQPTLHGFATYGHELESKYSLRVAWPDGDQVGEIVNKLSGLGFLLIELTEVADLWMLHTYTPLDSESMYLRTFFRYFGGAQEGNRRWTGAFIRATKDDIRVFEHKRYHSRPLLVEEERCITEYREWASQFYRTGANSHAPSPAVGAGARIG